MSLEDALRKLGVTIVHLNKEEEESPRYFQGELCPHEKAFMDLWNWMAQLIVDNPESRVIVLTTLHMFASTREAIGAFGPHAGWDEWVESIKEAKTLDHSKSYDPEETKALFGRYLLKTMELDKRVEREYAELEKKHRQDIEKN